LKFGQLLPAKMLCVRFLIQKELACQDLDVCNKVGPEGSKEEASPLSAHYPKNWKIFHLHLIALQWRKIALQTMSLF